MEKVTLQKQNLTPNFIGSWIMNPLSICDELITYFESNQNKQKRGITAGGENFDSKNSIDITISPKEIKLPGNEAFDKYFSNLFSCYQDYTTQWPFLTEFTDDSIVSPCISRDGSTIVFRHLFDLYRLDTRRGAGAEKIQLSYHGDVMRPAVIHQELRTAKDVSFSKDGLEVAFVAGGDVWVMDTVLREPRQVTDTPEEEHDVLFGKNTPLS